MRPLVPVIMVWIASCLIAQAEKPQAVILKTLRHMLDSQGRHSLSPSLLDRDAYQAHLRRHPEEVSGVGFDIQWKLRNRVPVIGTLKVEIRHGDGYTIGEFTKSLNLGPVKKRRSQWRRIAIKGEEYARLGKIIAWRVSLWDGETELAHQESFLW